MTTAITATTDPRPAATTQMLAAGRHLGISSPEFYDVLEKYTEDRKETLAYWFETGCDRNWGLSELSRQSGVHSTTISRLFRGIYEGDVAAQISKLSTARANLCEAIGNPDFIMTSLAREMFETFDKTRALRNVTIMWGPMGIGKTTIIAEYLRLHGHGQTFVVRSPGHGCTLYY